MNNNGHATCGGSTQTEISDLHVNMLRSPRGSVAPPVLSFWWGTAGSCHASEDTCGIRGPGTRNGRADTAARYEKS